MNPGLGQKIAQECRDGVDQLNEQITRLQARRDELVGMGRWMEEWEYIPNEHVFRHPSGKYIIAHAIFNSYKPGDRFIIAWEEHQRGQKQAKERSAASSDRAGKGREGEGK